MTVELSYADIKSIALKVAKESNPSEWIVLDAEEVDIYFWEPSQFFVAEVLVIFQYRDCLLYRIAINSEGEIIGKVCDSINVADELIDWFEKRESLLQPDDNDVVYIPDEYIPSGYDISE